jgi:hypothetical protein
MAGIPEVQRFFRAAGSIDVDKADVHRFRTFVDEKGDDLAIAGRNTACWNGPDVIAPQRQMAQPAFTLLRVQADTSAADRRSPR